MRNGSIMEYDTDEMISKWLPLVLEEIRQRITEINTFVKAKRQIVEEARDDLRNDIQAPRM